ncbi:MAG: DUF4157 domain-containing protein, partial [Candidatus Nanopelagicales bacterium]|nr:DUF4157 domain-containing protein [Candidatus Nanopelagicales bacterium]
TPGSSIHDWRGPVRADYLAVPMTAGVQRPHRTLLRPAGDFVVTRQPVRVVAPALRHAKGLAPSGRIAVRVSSARRIGKPVDEMPTGGVLGDDDAPITGPTVQASGPVPISDHEEFLSDDDAPASSGTITPTSARPLPRPWTPRPPRRQMSTGPVPLAPQGVAPARSVRKPEDQVPPGRGEEPGEREVLPSEPPSDVLAAITVTEDGRTLTGRTRPMRRPGTRPPAQSSAQSSDPTPPPTPAPSATTASPTTTSATSSPDTRPVPAHAHEHTRMPAETSNHVDAVNPPEPVRAAPAGPPAGSSPDSSSAPAVQSDGIQRRPRSTRIRGSAPAAATAAIAHASPVEADDPQPPSADTSAPVTPPAPSTQGAPVTTSPASHPSASSPSAQPLTPSTPSIAPATPAPVEPPETSASSPESAIDAVQSSAVQSPDLPPSSVQRKDIRPGKDVRGEGAEREDGRQPADSADKPNTNAAPVSRSSTPMSEPTTQEPTTPPSSTPLSGTSHQASAPVLSDAPLQRRATTTRRADDAGAPNDTLDPHGSSETSPVTASAAPSAAQTSMSTPTVNPIQAAPSSPSSPSTDSSASGRSEDSMQSPASVESSESEQSQPDQPTPASAGSPTTITVPADVRAAVAATTGVSPATASLVRGEAVSKRARDLQADAFTHQGHVHLPGTAPLTSDRQRRLLAHELTHVVQQGSGRQLPPEHTPEGQRLEQKALDVEGMLATPSSNGAPSLNVPTSALPTPASTPAMTPPVTTSTGVIPAASPAFAPAPTAPGGRPLAARARRGDTPTKRTQIPGKRVDASSSGDLVRVVAIPRSPRLSDRQKPDSSPAAATTPVGQRTPLQAGVPQASGLQPVTLPVVTSHNPATASQNPTASSATDTSVLQRRRSQATAPSTPVPPTTPPPSATAATPTPVTGHRPQNSRRSSTEREDATPDDAWLERHAAALYPLIRRHLRNELLRDRERRGRLVRED